jgi:II/X family phage/plasmid replication protein
MAMKFHLQSKFGQPYVSLKCSPAKIMQGHNVFGSLDLGLCSREMMMFLYEAYPDLYECLNQELTEVAKMDITFSARLPSEHVANQVITYLKNVSSKQRKSRWNAHLTTATWGSAQSRVMRLKAYLKAQEFQEQLDEHIKLAKKNDLAAQRVVNVMCDPRLQAWTRWLLRWEATILGEWLKRQDISINLFDLVKLQRESLRKGVCVMREWWQKATSDIFQALEGQTMRTDNDDVVLSKLMISFQTVTKTGRVSNAKANHLYDFYQSLKRESISSLKIRLGQNFFIKMRDLQSVGFSKAHLQNLKALHEDPNNMIPILRFVEVDFSSQRPDWYVEPVSYFARAA